MASVQEALDRLWSDQGLKDRLLSDPKPVLKEFGLNIPDNVKVHIHENTDKVFNAVLPAKPDAKVALGQDALSQIIERAWSDPAFKKKLLSDPKEAAAEMGTRLPASIEVRIWENTGTEEHIVLPANPVETELSEMELEAVAGGSISKATPVAVGCTGGASPGIVNGTALSNLTTIGGVFGPASTAGPVVASGQGKS